jgi:hypothetical protein
MNIDEALNSYFIRGAQILKIEPFKDNFFN